MSQADDLKSPITNFSSLLSQEALALLKATGTQLIESIGIDVIRAVVLDVLTGRNIRNSTETLTRRRIAMLNLALVDLFFNGIRQDPDFVDKLPYIATDILMRKNDKVETWLAQWALGLTGKGVQNILRDDQTRLIAYRDIYVQTCQAIIEQSRASYGDLRGHLQRDSGTQIEVNWLFLTYLLNTVGSETLTIRGSEKSLYGKFFEKLVLGALLHILDFEYVPDVTLGEAEGIFWLASGSGKERESDATILYQPGRGIRVDIGFIGRGNTEISLDKVSRYRREIEMGARQWYMGTIIIVDRIGARSRISELAGEIDGTIVQMSGGYWPQRIAITLNGLVGFQHPLVTMKPEFIEDFLRDKLADVPLRDFIQNTAEDDTAQDASSDADEGE